jgi:23S rRNA pseudouridine1911/1915/1917 synthase
MPVTTIQIDRGDVGLRLDRVLLRHLIHLPGVTRNRLQRLIDQGAVLINGRLATRSSARVAAADAIAIELPERQLRVTPAAESIPLDVLYEDDSLLIVNKPPGQVAHPAFRNTSGTLLNALVAHAAERWKPALLSRLDKGTSGLVLVAKSAAIQRALQQSGTANAFEKDYLAIVHGRPPSKGTIDLALDRDPWDRRRVTVRDRGGVPSVTRFARLTTARIAPDRHLSLLRCRLITGRMHQIRVHLAAKGWPIVGDVVYGKRAEHAAAIALVSMPRQALHAWRLVFTHPLTLARIEVTAPIPLDMQQLMAQARFGPIEQLDQPSTRAMSSSTVPSAE